MNEIKKWQNIFASPCCRAELEIKNNYLVCKKCRSKYPVINGIPRLVVQSGLSKPVKATAKSFGWEWTKGWNKSVFDSGKPDTKKETEVFLEKSGLPSSFFRNKLILDAGCGFGRYSYVARKLGGTVVSIDLSEAVESAKKLLTGVGKGIVVQANISNLPFKKGTFDHIFSFGVLHHTPDTKKSFQALVPFVKPGGTISIWVYRKDEPERERIYNEIRKTTLKMDYKTLYDVSKILSLVAQSPSVPKEHKNRIPISDLAHNNFDWYSCPIRNHHTEDEVRGWFDEVGLENVKIFGWIKEKYGGAIGAFGMKRTAR